MPNFPSNPYVGQVVVWQGCKYEWDGEKWTNLSIPLSASVPVFVSVSPPQPPLLEGTLWFNSLTQVLNIWVVEPGQSVWVPVTEQALSNLCVFVSISPPENPTQGSLWYNPQSHLFQVWVGSEWEIISDCVPDQDSPPVVVSVSPPSNPTQGTLWFRPGNSTLHLWVDSITGGSWVVISGSNVQKKPTVFVSSSTPSNPNQGDLWFKPQLNELRVWNEGVINQWLLILGSAINGSPPPVYVSVDEPINPKQNYLWFNPQNGELQVRDDFEWDLICTTPSSVPPPVSVSVSPPPYPKRGDLWFDASSGSLSVWFIDVDGGQWLETARGPSGVSQALPPLIYDPDTKIISLPIGSSSGTVAAGDDPRFSDLLSQVGSMQNSVGPFSRDGGQTTVGVKLMEVSNNPNLIASTGQPDINTAPTQYAIKSYLDINYSKPYVYQQNNPSKFWTINHNLGYKPSVELFGPGSQKIDGEVIHSSNNQCQVYFTSPISGFARLN
jgi:hypothetical protein